MKGGIRGEDDRLGGEVPAAPGLAPFWPLAPFVWRGIDEPAMRI
jgi:hypothetical protein